MMDKWMRKNLLRLFHDQRGLSLTELLVALTLLTLALGAITSMIIMSMRSQEKINAEFRSQLDARVVLYDMEKNIAEAKRKDTSNNQPVFQSDLISFPSQNGSQWITYVYATPPGASSGTIIRKITSGKPTIPVQVSSTDKQMINVREDGSGNVTTVERVSQYAPIFTYYGDSGLQITAPVTDPRSVRSVKIVFKVTESDGHARNEDTISSSQINLRNF
ncbi:MAG: prepilin-type N-terminal cleavage/methylation domain-containing protein [Thermoleophilia bacterium]|jgi:prepilin-type N-terminal cleavage/methylation domain-containing protein